MKIGQRNLDFVKVVPMGERNSANMMVGQFQILYKYVETRWGRMLLAATEIGLCYAGFVSSEEKVTLEDMKRRFANFDIQEGWGRWQQLALGFLEADDDIEEPVCLHLKGTVFQLGVWKELLQIPAGKTVSYKDIAIALHCPRAYRAVGTAVGCNPVSVLIPCHRVLRQDGGMGGYHWGLVYKRRLLDAENIR